MKNYYERILQIILKRRNYKLKNFLGLTFLENML